MPNCCSRKKKVQGDRSFIVGERSQTKFPSNGISTTRYNPVTFLPLSLLLQFSRYANIYFLINAILQSIPAISPLSPISAVAPLVVVIALSILREGFEDMQRYKSDLDTNSTKSQRYMDGVWEDIEWKDLVVGDIIRVEEGQFFPADCVVFASSDEKGIVFINTSSLDGEKNLKQKFALKETQELAADSRELRIMGTIRCGPPSPELNEFSGSISLGAGQTLLLSAKQLMLRGSALVNTSFAICIIVYTGGDSKIMKNADQPHEKQSSIEKAVNNLIIAIIGLQFVMSLVIFVCCCIWTSKYAAMYDQFFTQRHGPFVEGLLTFFTTWLILTSMIPISLIITMEVVKMIQAYMIDKDLDMKDQKENRFSKAFNSALNEELGQVEYIFSDKTGTLTSNVMEFKYCFIGNTFFGDEEFVHRRQTIARRPTYINRKTGFTYSFEDRDLNNLLEGLADGSEQRIVFGNRENRVLFALNNVREIAEHFLLTLSLCHECIVESNGVSFQGPSPDEVTLVDAARHLGYNFRRSTNFGKVVLINGEEHEIEVLDFFEFDSARKRASVVIRHNGIIKMLTKGADTVILARLSHFEQPNLERTKALLDRFSLEGLRTLCFGMRVFAEEEWSDIKRTLRSLQSYSDKTDRRRDFISDQVERDFMLIGCTAVEDKLQDGVPEAIADFIQANVKVWMLTGDKLETAENIAYSCRLIQPDFYKLYLTDGSQLSSSLSEFSRVLKLKASTDKYSFIAEGKALLELANDKELGRSYLEEVFSKCSSVICCRMSPKQKGDIVRLVKSNTQKVTLSIGDGANDVNMIQEAHIGIGLYGKEGMRAVQASDYGLVDFKSLWKLLFVHGRWSYIRISEMILYFFYKNFTFVLPQFYYAFYNGFSSQTIYEDYYITFFNLFFTAFPVIVRAVLDQDVYYKQWSTAQSGGEAKALHLNEEIKRYYPHLYHVGQQNLIFKFVKQLEKYNDLGPRLFCNLNRDLFHIDGRNQLQYHQPKWNRS